LIQILKKLCEHEARSPVSPGLYLQTLIVDVGCYKSGLEIRPINSYKLNFQTHL